MSSIVLELQRDALDRSVPITDLLRKALVVARKLHQSSFHEWIQNELSGYRGETAIPDYREMVGQVKAFGPYQNWQPFSVNDPKIDDMMSRRHTNQPIAEIDDLYQRQNEDASTVYMPFAPEHQKMLRDAVREPNAQFSLFISASAFASIVDVVRNTVLNWALQLEEDGILGEGLSFSGAEKETAAHANYNINNFFGDVEGSQIQQATVSSSQQQFSITKSLEEVTATIAALKDSLDKLDLEKDKKDEATSDLATIESQISSPRPKPSIIEESFRSIRTILEGAGGGTVAHLLIELGKSLGF